MFGRVAELRQVRARLAASPVVAILGPRQVGKTTLARDIARTWSGPTTVFDLEDPRDVGRLTDASTTLRPLRGLVVIDEIQRRPDLFPVLRVLADRPRRPARFLLLGSASPALLRQTSESLAGRIAYVELAGFGLADVDARWARLWLRGGFPRSYLARTDDESQKWRRDLVRTFVERDLPQLAGIAPGVVQRFWTMLAHYHGQIWNGAELARAFGIGETTVRRYLDLLAGTFMVRVLPPWSENLGKRVVRAPKVYVADSGLLHTLLDLGTMRALEGHPKVGASFEGFALTEALRALGARPEQCHFWATHQGAELDLLVVRAGRRRGFEFKRTDAPAVTKSMRIAFEDLRLASLDVVHVGAETYSLGEGIRAVAISRLMEDLAGRRPRRRPPAP
ncbi:MAG: ATP-binding protein [Candidatus Rokuibacteriota bacterium]